MRMLARNSNVTDKTLNIRFQANVYAIRMLQSSNLDVYDDAEHPSNKHTPGPDLLDTFQCGRRRYPVS